MRCLPNDIQMEIVFSDPRPLGRMITGHSNNRIASRFGSISGTTAPSHTQMRSVGKSFTYICTFSDIHSIARMRAH